jgi:hypothetical protein
MTHPCIAAAHCTFAHLGTGAQVNGDSESLPYRSKDELHRKDIIPRAVHEDIKDRIVARQ